MAEMTVNFNCPDSPCPAVHEQLFFRTSSRLFIKTFSRTMARNSAVQNIL